MRDLNDLYFFHAVAAHQGFTAASHAIGTPKATLSKRVAVLENELGVRLLERTTRHLRLTEVGKEVYEQVSAMLDAAAGADAAAAQAQAEPNGIIRLSTPQGLIQDMLIEILPAFLAKYPKVRVQIKILNRPADLVDDGVDVVLRARSKLDTDPSLVLRKLAMSRNLLVASPTFVKDFGCPERVEGLVQIPTLSVFEEREEVTWELIGPDEQLQRIVHRPRLMCTSFDVLRKAAIAGSGITLLPDFVAGPALRSGELVHVLPGWYTPYGIIHALFSSRKGLVPALRVLIDFLALEIPKRVHMNIDHDQER